MRGYFLKLKRKERAKMSYLDRYNMRAIFILIYMMSSVTTIFRLGAHISKNKLVKIYESHRLYLYNAITSKETIL